MSRNEKNKPKILNPELLFKKSDEDKSSKSAKRNKYWRSLNILNNPESNKDNRKQEFPEGQDGEINLDKMSPNSRRKFLALMTASGVFATASCTDYRDKGEIVNYASKPESIQPGIPNYYASTVSRGENTFGILVKTREGRPIKVDGNPEHPGNKGKVDVQTQASILDLYNPQRYKKPYAPALADMNLDKGKGQSWDKVDAEIVKRLNSAVAAGKEIAIIVGAINSPSTKNLLADFSAKYPTAKVYSYEQFNSSEKDAAWMESYGEPVFPGVDLKKANIIVSLECDFLGVDGNSVENTAAFTSRRDIEDLDNFNKLYTVEGGLSLTGSNSDYRFRLSPINQLDLAKSLAVSLGVPGVSGSDLKDFARANGINASKAEMMLKDLKANAGKSILMAGRHLPKDVHLIVNAINDYLGNTGLYRSDAHTNIRQVAYATKDELMNLVSDMSSGKVSVAIAVDANPVYNMPRFAGFGEAFSKVETKITFAAEPNETAKASDYILPSNHYLESWGDYHSRAGVLSLQQPVISELHDSRQPEAAMLNWINGGSSYNFDIYHKYIMNRWQNEVYSISGAGVDFRTYWMNALHDGVVSVNHNSPERVYNSASLSSVSSSASENNYTLVLSEHPLVGDGRYASNGFLQETPHPISKVTWDNYASVSPKTAKDLGLNFNGESNNAITVSLGGNSLDIPVVIQPGIAENVIQIDLGYGRSEAGIIGSDAGFDASVLMNPDTMVTPWIYTRATIAATTIMDKTTVRDAFKTFDPYILSPKQYRLATTQEHHQLDDTLGDGLAQAVSEGANSGKEYELSDFDRVRNIIQESTVEDYKHGHTHLHKHETKSIMANHEYEGIKWAMAIDMNKCTGCNACITACNVESNIPVVGKDEVLMGREMHWMRMDRYYSGTEDDVQVSIQPMLCQQCDNAPCENVCPVVATTHSPDGLNQMVYNRCVGTRYCANNCPYKVRRFNFYDFRDNLARGYYKSDNGESFQYSDEMQHSFNPEVTVRSRGVMEKCDFCTSRIATARSLATKEKREFKGSDVITACQEACPANAIYFGDSNDPNSTVSKFRKHDLGYHVLDMLDVRPQVTYVAKLNNVVPEKEESHGNNH